MDYSSRVIRPPLTFGELGFDGVAFGSQVLQTPERTPEGDPIAVHRGFEEIKGLGVLQAARARWYPFDGADTRPVPSSVRLPERWVAVSTSTESRIVMFSTAMPCLSFPSDLALIYLYWCDKAYMTSRSSAAQISLHNDMMLAQASVIQQTGFRGYVFKLPNPTLRSQLDRITSVRVAPADDVANTLGLREQ